MASWRRMFLVAHVWLTALMTLLTGLPHFRCQCPSGYVKSLCFSGFFSTGECCCAGSCCAPSSGAGATRSCDAPIERKVKRSCCCCHATAAQNTGKKYSHSEIKIPGCKRTLIQATQVRHSSPQPINDCLVAGLSVFDLAPFDLSLSVQAGDSLSSWQSYSQPPPTNLVVTFQHFLI
jgi:hypothetical protein